MSLIEETNPHWEDLAVALGFEPLPEEPKRPCPPNRHAELDSASSPETRGAHGGLDPDQVQGDGVADAARG